MEALAESCEQLATGNDKDGREIPLGCKCSILVIGDFPGLCQNLLHSWGLSASWAPKYIVGHRVRGESEEQPRPPRAQKEPGYTL